MFLSRSLNKVKSSVILPLQKIKTFYWLIEGRHSKEKSFDSTKGDNNILKIS